MHSDSKGENNLPSLQENTPLNKEERRVCFKYHSRIFTSLSAPLQRYCEECGYRSSIILQGLWRILQKLDRKYIYVLHPQRKVYLSSAGSIQHTCSSSEKLRHKIKAVLC